jgi:hypothetical protein
LAIRYGFLSGLPLEFNRGHTAHLVRVRLPERAVQWAAGVLASDFDGLGNFDLLELA